VSGGSEGHEHVRRSSFSKFEKKNKISGEGKVEDELRRSIGQHNADEAEKTLSSFSPR
jgi:hypothetical protein